MDFSISAVWIWLVVGLVLAGIELLAGNFYFLVMGLACLVAGAAAWAGVAAAWQLTVFALCAAAGGWAVRRMAQSRRNDECEALQNPDVGRTVTVTVWQQDRTARVDYRGAEWTAVLAEGESPAAGVHEIVAVDGARLLVRAKAK